jgi:putative glutamine amidotransferase
MRSLKLIGEARVAIELATVVCNEYTPLGMAVNPNPSGPLIGITPVPRDVITGYGPDLADTAVKGMIDGVVRAGGVPVVLPVCAPQLAAAQLAPVSALILSGGQDLTLPGTARDDAWVDPLRDLHEFALVEAAAAAEIPVLGVCRGMQLMNVSRGGTLIQAIEGHDAGERHGSERHQIKVKLPSRLAEVVDTDSFDVNTIHHQALDRLGSGMEAIAWSEDGVVEAAQSDQSGWFLGVQWHPELMPGEVAGDGLFSAIVERAAAYEVE